MALYRKLCRQCLTGRHPSSASGKAALTRPLREFNDSALDQIFGKRVPRVVDPAIRTVERDNPITNTSTALTSNSTGSGNVSQESSAKQKKPIGGIVGGTIGGLALLCALVGFAFLSRRRRKSQSDTPDDGEKPELSVVPPRKQMQQEEEHVGGGDWEVICCYVQNFHRVSDSNSMTITPMKHHHSQRKIQTMSSSGVRREVINPIRPRSN